jgi:hypothetical protein
MRETRKVIDIETVLKSTFRLVAAATILFFHSGSVLAQTAAPAPAFQPFLRNMTRVEMWRYFEPPPPSPTFTPGDPTTAHIGNRLLAGVRFRHGHLDATAALQYVQFGGLPADAIGPGALGTGALYYDHSGSTTSHQVYLKTVSIALRQIAGHLDVQVGRLPYTSGAERPSGVPKIEAVKRQRLDSRLVGEFEWSLYQRAFDGLRADWTSKSLRITGTAFQPTQGGFEDAAGVSMSRVRVLSAVATAAPGAILPKSEVQLFVHRYDDRRPVSARPDNTGRSASAADIGITAIGGHVAGARQAGPGEFDGMVWFAGQFGDWYEQRHRGVGVTAEAGYQWSKAPWTPWVRGGITWFSGDGDPRDATHGTFFPMVPTVRRYAQSTLYSMANLRDVMAQVILRPAPDVTLRVDGHFLSLATAADGWYAGSGATQESGRLFGYTLRSSGNERGLMNVAEGSADWRLNPAWSVAGYLGVASSGKVVRHSFQPGPASFFYLENVVQF